MGGIVEVYLANADDVTAITLTDNKVSGITMDTGKKFKKYEFARNVSSMNSNYTIDEANGVKFVETDLTMVFNKMNTSKRIEVTAMAQGELICMVKDANNVYWLLGYDTPVRISAGDGLTGTARSDRNGYSITLHDYSLQLPYEINVGTGAGAVDLSTIVG